MILRSSILNKERVPTLPKQEISVRAWKRANQLLFMGSQDEICESEAPAPPSIEGVIQ